MSGYTSMTLVTADGHYASSFTNTQLNSVAVSALDSALCDTSG